VDTSGIRKALEAKGVRPFSPDELDLPGQNLTQVLREAVQRADLVVAVVDSTAASNLVFYEVGMAQGMNKPASVLLVGDASPAPWATSGIPCFRIHPEQPAALDFALTQILAIPQHAAEPPPSPAQRTHPLGDRVDELLAALRARGEDIPPAEFAQIIERAIRESGVRSISPGAGEPASVDFAVWSDDLSPWVENPLAVELHRNLRSGADVHAAVGRLTRAMVRSSMAWGLLIYVGSPIEVENVIAAPNVVSISAGRLLERLRTVGFGELVRDLRRQRVHGAC
jgi:hypothetical protein